MWPFLFCIRLGNLGKTEPGKLFRNFKWVTNREDGSDFDDFWTKRIVSARTISGKISERTKRTKSFRKFQKFFVFFFEQFFV